MPQWRNFNLLAAFLQVARHRGIRPARPNLGYRISDSALSEQMSQLEADYKHLLFVRKPFHLTPIGQRIEQTCAPHFEAIQRQLDEILAGGTSLIIIGAPDFVQRQYLPTIFRDVQQRDAGIRFALDTGNPATLFEKLQAGRVDLIITLGHAHEGITACTQLLKLPLALIAPESQEPSSVRDLIGHAPLICPSGNVPLCQMFDEGLRGLGKAWHPQLYVDSVASVSSFVAAGHGVGLGLNLPALLGQERIRMVPLDDFGALPVVAAWRKPTSPAVRKVLDALQRQAKVMAA